MTLTSFFIEIGYEKPERLHTRNICCLLIFKLILKRCLLKAEFVIRIENSTVRFMEYLIRSLEQIYEY